MTTTTNQRGRRARTTGASSLPAERSIGRPGHLAISFEVLLYAGILLIAIVTRFWDLGTRALHHDESLHAQFSWMLAMGRGYTHDPLMHGPFLFHANALAYLLFGANDATSRIVPALTGCGLVLIPWLLRKQLGRWGALSASLFLLLSPGFLYYSRFIRHDIYTATATLLLFAAIMRYIDERQARWIYVAAVALAWAITNHEITYAVVFIDVTFFAIVIAWRLSRRLAFVGGAFAALMGLTFLAAPRLLRWPPLPAIPWQNPNQGAIAAYIGGLLTNPVIIALLVEGVALLAASLVILNGVARANVVGGRGSAAATGQLTWLDRLFARVEPGSSAYALYSLLRDQRLLWSGLLLFFALFAVLFTTLFANLPGLLSGMFGAIGYWLGQHGVRRGEQPWFYYLVLMPQYELMAVTLGGAMTALTGWRVIRFWRKVSTGTAPHQAGSHRLLTHAFLVYWAILMFSILSWAGEKMPWLITHATLPFTVLAGALMGEVIERLSVGGPALDRGGMAWGLRYRWPLAGLYGGLVLIIAGVMTFSAAAASHSDTAIFGAVGAALLAIGLATFGYALLVGYRRAALVAVVALSGLFALAEVRLGIVASFLHGDVPKEQLIYVQTAPDITRVVAEIEQLSRELTGGQEIGVIYDGSEGGVVWPIEWYLRDFKNRRFMPEGPTSEPGPEIPIILLGKDNKARAEPFLSEYEAVEYVLRWHYPEEATYRPIAIAPELRPGRSAWRSSEEPHGLAQITASIVASFAAQREPSEQARLWRYLLYREPYAPVGSADFFLFVRKDVLRYYNAIRY